MATKDLLIKVLDETSEEELVDTLALLIETFGPGPATEAWLRTVVQSKDVHVLAAYLSGRMVGLGICRILDPKNAVEYSAFGDQAVEMLSAHRVGSLQTLLTEKSLQGQGIGYSVAIRMGNWLVNQGCSLAIAVSWENGQTHTSEASLKRAGFEWIGRIENYYLELSRTRGHRCPVCNGACKCSASLYARLLDRV